MNETLIGILAFIFGGTFIAIIRHRSKKWVKDEEAQKNSVDQEDSHLFI